MNNPTQLEAILPPTEKAVLEHIIATGKMAVRKKEVEYKEDGSFRHGFTLVDAPEAKIRRAKILLQREEDRRKRVERQRKEHERLKNRANLPEAEALEELKAKLASAKAELKELQNTSVSGRIKDSRTALLEAEAAHAVGDASADLVARRQDEFRQAEKVADSLERDKERTRLVIGKLEAKVTEAEAAAYQTAEKKRAEPVERLRRHLEATLKAAGELDEMEKTLKAALPGIRSKIDATALRRLKAWAEDLSDA